MLSRLRMIADDCILEYEHLAANVFSNARIFHQASLLSIVPKRPKYDERILEDVIHDVTRRRSEIQTDDDGKLFKTGNDICRA
jgi:hypothetical protein